MTQESVMKIVFIIAREDSQHSTLHQLSQGRLFPPVSLAPMVRMIGKQQEVCIIDERRKDVLHEKSADIVVIFINSYNQQRARKLAIKYQMRGSFVVLTGPVLSLDSLQQGLFANCLFIGSGEECMPQFLQDYHNGRVMGFYLKEVRKAGAVALSMTIGGTTLSIAS
jgi:hypothetical protein